MPEIIDNIKFNTDIPVIDNTGCCYDEIRDITIYNCRLSDDNDFIEGFTEEGTKAKYIFNKNKWFYGHEISQLNFVPLTERSPEEQFAIRSKAGKSRWDKERNKRTLNDIAKELLETDMSEANINEVLGSSKELLGDDRSVAAVMMVKMIQTACAGSFKAAEFVRDTAGYNPRELKIDLKADVITDSDRSLLEKIDKRLTG